MTRTLLPALIISASLLLASSALAQTVTSVEALRAALASANPGDTITIAPGTYRLDQRLNITRPGTPLAPITLRADPPHSAILEVNTLIGVKWDAPHWIMNGLHFRGVCSDHSSCEHAIQLVGSSDFTTIQHNIFESFNAQIKANGEGPDGARNYPDDVLIQGNIFFDATPRQTANPVTKIDVVGGRRWIVRGNFIHDFEKAQGNLISYGAFLKGNSRDGIFERNLIACELLHSGNTRIGLSLGGGGTSPDTICEDQRCTPEHQNGIIRNNIIANCPNSLGIYLNQAENTTITHNTIYRTTGIDVRFDRSSAIIANNLVAGRVRTRDNATITQESHNITLSDAAFAQRFAQPSALDFSLLNGQDILNAATPAHYVTDDLCGQQRKPTADIGTIEYLTNTPCLTNTLPPTSPQEPPPPLHQDPSPHDMGPADLGTIDPPDLTPPHDMPPTEEMDPSPTDMSPADLDTAPTAADMTSTPADMSAPADTDPEQDSCLCATPAAPPTRAPVTALLLATTLLLARRTRTRT